MPHCTKRRTVSRASWSCDMVPSPRACRRPDPWPGRFGFHEVFHAATIAAFLLHYSAVWITAVGV